MTGHVIELSLHPPPAPEVPTLCIHSWSSPYPEII